MNIALRLIESHVARQNGLFVYVYNRDEDNLVPITWKARGITRQAFDDKMRRPTNDWSHLESQVEYNDGIVVDVGANVGATVARFAARARHVYAFEPHPGNHAFLLDQIRIRKLGNVSPFQMALAAESGKAAFFERESHGIHSLGRHNKGKVQSTFDVEVERLDEIWRTRIKDPIALLKVDVEGFEPEVFEGSAHLLEQKLINAVVFEFSPRIYQLRGLPEDAPLRILRRHGYDVFAMDGHPVSEEAELPRLCDLIARPKTG
ncbi:FkbM family methyltransferase [Defluviimonas sp. WL0075]|uniref:FkbM family methyltransferase n=1 Tax=Albidovulum sediminicola TaxID=2984331 RepID=A0ABT2Z344_9RHOB|nr:FkbM family methyltransferase [Defluviimonas sp. WL0075]